jgi:uncharacterized Tic20 family protein
MTTTAVSIDSRNWAVIGHSSAFIQFIGIPAFVGPLVVWLIRKDDPFSADQAKEALNFNLSILVYMILSALAILLIVGLILLPIVMISWFVLVIVASVNASNGDAYRYPMTIRFIS